MAGIFEFAETAESFKACVRGDKHHIVFHGTSTELRWVKVGMEMMLYERTPHGLSPRRLKVAVSHIESVTRHKHVISFLHTRRDTGETCCAARKDLNGKEWPT